MVRSFQDITGGLYITGGLFKRENIYWAHWQYKGKIIRQNNSAIHGWSHPTKGCWMVKGRLSRDRKCRVRQSRNRRRVKVRMPAISAILRA